MKLEECLDRVKSCIRKFADPRQGNNKSYSMEEIGMAAYSVFHLQSPSFLSHQKNMKRKKGSHNGKTLFGFSNIPTDNHIRQVLDFVSPEAMNPFFDYALGTMNLEEWLVEDRLLVALDGVTFFSSSTINCSCCLRKELSNGPAILMRPFVLLLFIPAKNKFCL